MRTKQTARKSTGGKSAASTRRSSAMDTPEQPPAKRKRAAYNLEDTFEVIVGDPLSPDSKRFTLHTNVFIPQCGFLAASRKPAWIAQNPGKPVDLEDEDPVIFQAYMNCVYFGSETIENWIDSFRFLAQVDPPTNASQQAQDSIFTRLIRVYLLCERLIDFKAANLVIDEIVCFADEVGCIPLQAPTSLAYASTAEGSPLRALLRDYWVYDSGTVERQALRADGFPVECLQDVALAVLEKFDEFPQNAIVRGDLALSVMTLCVREECRYHLHDEKHPQCAVKKERDDASFEAALE